MNSRWSFGNYIWPISHKQFIELVAQFKKAAEESFGTECSLEISALRDPKIYTTFCDSEIEQSLKLINDAQTVVATKNLADVTPELWKQAGYVEVEVRPLDEKKAPASAFGHVEFKGRLPLQANFYIQPDGENAKRAMLARNPSMSVGDGFESNGKRSAAVPASLSFVRGSPLAVALYE
jgi:hypothetical protein